MEEEQSPLPAFGHRSVQARTIWLVSQATKRSYRPANRVSWGQMIKRSRKRSEKKIALARPPISLGLGINAVGLALHLIQLYREIQHLNWMTENRIMVDPYPIWPQIHALFIVGFLLSVVGLLPRVRL